MYRKIILVADMVIVIKNVLLLALHEVVGQT